MSSTPQFILASASPRRADLLRQAGYEFEIQTGPVDERAIGAETPESLAEALAWAKAEAVAVELPDALVLGADTLGYIDGEYLHKPASKEAARTMLLSLRGRTHRIITGYALLGKNRDVRIAGHVESQVRFRAFSDDELEVYLNTDEPYDKAGGYGIQGKGGAFVDELVGDYTNVVGLPMDAIKSALARAGLAPRTIRAVLFDADGTLVDTTDLIVLGYMETLRSQGYGEYAQRERVMCSLGGPVAHTLSRILDLPPHDPRIAQLVLAHDHVQDAHPEWIRAYPGAADLLGTLRAHGLKVGLCTSGSKYHVERNFRSVGIDPRTTFDTIVCADDDLPHKPEPHTLIEACARLGVEPHEAVYVGDHHVDMLAAHAAAVNLSIGMSHGLARDDELTRAGAHVVLHNLSSVGTLLAEDDK